MNVQPVKSSKYTSRGPVYKYGKNCSSQPIVRGIYIASTVLRNIMCIYSTLELNVCQLLSVISSPNNKNI